MRPFLTYQLHRQRRPDFLCPSWLLCRAEPEPQNIQISAVRKLQAHGKSHGVQSLLMLNSVKSKTVGGRRKSFFFFTKVSEYLQGTRFKFARQPFADPTPSLFYTYILSLLSVHYYLNKSIGMILY